MVTLSVIWDNWITAGTGQNDAFCVRKTTLTVNTVKIMNNIGYGHGIRLAAYPNPFSTSISIKCSMPNAEFGMANVTAGIYDITGNFKEGVKYLDLLKFKYPNNPWVWRYLGEYCLKINKKRKAIESYKKLIELDPSEADNWKLLLQAYIFAKAYNEGIFYFNIILKKEQENFVIWMIIVIICINIKEMISICYR